jgi:HK97 family phage prohead protease
MTVTEWLARGKPGDHALAASGVVTQLRSYEGVATEELYKGGELRFRITTPRVDRYKDRVLTEGAQVDAYLQNPVILFGHAYSALPVGRALTMEPTPEALFSNARFLSREENPFGNTVFVLLVRKDLNAVSIGFRPLKIVEVPERGGMDFLEWELLEYSVVPIPANPEALVVARNHGVDLAPLVDYWEMALADAELAAAGDTDALHRVRRYGILKRQASGLLVPEERMTQTELEQAVNKLLGDLTQAVQSLRDAAVAVGRAAEEAVSSIKSAAQPEQKGEGQGQGHDTATEEAQGGDGQDPTPAGGGGEEAAPEAGGEDQGRGAELQGDELRAELRAGLGEVFAKIFALPEGGASH